jgi:DNA-binding transcriptional ArsR family regulator
VTAGTSAPEWAEVTAGCRFGWQRTAAAIRAWIAAGEISEPGPVPPVKALAAELDEAWCTVGHALESLAAARVVDRTGHRGMQVMYYTRPLAGVPVLDVPRRVRLPGLIAAWDGRYAVDEFGDAKDPFRARPLQGAPPRLLTACTPGLLGVLIAADWAGTR